MEDFFAVTIIGFVNVIKIILNLYVFVIIASALISWVSPDPYNPIVRFLRAATEPLYSIFRRYVPFTVVGGIDLCPIIAFILIQLINHVILSNLIIFAHKIGKYSG